MSKLKHTQAVGLPRSKLPRIEPAFVEALEAIARAEHWGITELLADIKKQRGTSMAIKARLYALDYYRGNTLPRGFAEGSASPLETALHHVRTHKVPAQKIAKKR